MAGARNEKLREALMHAAAEYLSREANRDSLITVTGAALSGDGRRATVFVTVLPDEAQERALQFANRHRAAFASYFTSRVRGAQTPHVEFALDRGEKNRQHLEELGN